MAAYHYLNPVATPLLIVRDNRILFANTAALQFSGYSPDELENIPFTDLVLPEHRPKISFAPTPSAPLTRLETVLLTARGDMRPVELSAELADEHEAAVWLVTVIDLTRSQVKETPIRRQEKFSRTFQDLLKSLQNVSLRLAQVDHLDDLYRQIIELGRSELQFDRLGLWLVDEDVQYLCGTFGTDENGQTRDERGIRQKREMLHRTDLERVRLFDSEIQVYTSQNSPLGDQDGNIIGAGWVIIAVMIDRGETTGYLCADNLFSQKPMAAYQPELLALYTATLTHLIRRKRTEAELHEARERYAELVANIPGMVYRTRVAPDHSWSFDYLSPRCFEFTGVEGEQALKDMSLLMAQIYPDDLADYQRAADESNQRLTPFIWEGRFVVNNEVTWRRVESHPHRMPDDTVIWDGIVTDITAQRQAEEAPRQTEERYRLLAEFTTDMVTLMQPDGNFVYISPSCERTLGFTRDELASPAPSSVTYADDFSQALATLLDLPNLKETTRLEFRVRHRSGEYLWLESYARPIFDEQGRVAQVLVSSRDITERRQIQTLRFEQEKLQVALDKERELSDLKTHMMERISHEFRTPLTIIGTASDLLERYHERLNDEQRLQRLEQIKNQIKHLSVMLDNIGMLTYSRLTRMPLNLRALNLEKLCQEAIVHVQREMPVVPRIVFTAGSGIQRVTGDKELIWHILYQLLSNAVKYSPEAGTVWLGASREHNTLVLVIRDEGTGISLEDQKRMFEPFYRSRRLDEKPGLGLGLSIVRDALDAHYGSLTVDSEAGKGTVFTVRLPALLPGENREAGPLFAQGD